MQIPVSKLILRSTEDSRSITAVSESLTCKQHSSTWLTDTFKFVAENYVVFVSTTSGKSTSGLFSGRVKM